MNVINVDHLTKRFGKTIAVDDLSLQIEKGEIFGFLGPNGAGKTTTIRCLLDFIRPTSGDVSVLGHNCQKESVEVRKLVRYVGSGMKLYDNWNGWDHIRMAQSFRGSDGELKKYLELFSFNPDIRVHDLSFGNKQKLMLILALIGKPKVLILDEPTVGLDPILQNAIYDVLKGLQDDGATIFMSSHNLHEVEQLCSRAAISKPGQLVATESIRGLRQKKLYKVEATFAEAFDAKKFEAENVKIINARPRFVTLQVQGDVNKVVYALSKEKLTDLSVARADLEDVFLDFYR